MSQKQTVHYDIDPKTISGKRIRRGHTPKVLAIYFIAAVLTLIRALFDGRDPHITFIVFLNYLCIFIPIAVLGIVYNLLKGQLLAILAEDRLYFFCCEIRLGHRQLLSDGYVYYSAIKNIDLVTPSKHSHVMVNGENFQIKIDGLGRGFVRKLKKQMAADPGLPFPEPGIVIAEDNSENTSHEGLFAELWNTYEKGETSSWFDGETEILDFSENCGTLDVTVIKNGHEVSVNISDTYLSITADESDKWEDILLADLVDAEDFKTRLQNFINENSIS